MGTGSLLRLSDFEEAFLPSLLPAPFLEVLLSGSLEVGAEAVVVVVALECAAFDLLLSTCEEDFVGSLASRVVVANLGLLFGGS